MRFFKITILISVGISFFVSCSEKSETLFIPDHSRYFPVFQGQQQCFEVREINIDAPLNIYDTSTYYLYVISDTVYTSNNSIFGDYTLLKSASLNITDPLTPVGRMQRELTSPHGNYIENKDNCRKIKSLLPISKNKTWNADVFCTSSDTNSLSKIKVAHIQALVHQHNFDSIVQIIHLYDSSLIHLNVRQEIWAAGFGLIYSEITNIVSNSADLDFTLPIRQRIVTGKITDIKQIIPIETE